MTMPFKMHGCILDELVNHSMIWKLFKNNRKKLRSCHQRLPQSCFVLQSLGKGGSLTQPKSLIFFGRKVCQEILCLYESHVKIVNVEDLCGVLTWMWVLTVRMRQKCTSPLPSVQHFSVWWFNAIFTYKKNKTNKEAIFFLLQMCTHKIEMNENGNYILDENICDLLLRLWHHGRGFILLKFRSKCIPRVSDMFINNQASAKHSPFTRVSFFLLIGFIT